MVKKRRLTGSEMLDMPEVMKLVYPGYGGLDENDGNEGRRHVVALRFDVNISIGDGEMLQADGEGHGMVAKGEEKDQMDVPSTGSV